MADTTAKKEKEKKKKRKKEDKAQKMQDRKQNNAKGKSLEDMMAYVDEDGNLSETPPDGVKRKTINAEDIQLGAAARVEEDPADKIRKGVVTFFNDAKGFGFISDLESRVNVFVHVHQLLQPIKEGDTVTFETERNAKGLSALRVKKA